MSIASLPSSTDITSPRIPLTRPTVRGKFLFEGDRKLYVRGATYGAFAPNRAGEQFPEARDTARDLSLMRAAGINTILTYTVPPLWLLDLAEEHGIRVLVTVPWMEYVCFLENRKNRREVMRDVRDGVAACRQHPAVLMYCIGKEIPPPIVRWYGARTMEGFLKDLCAVAKDVDPSGLVTYTNFPTTEYLELPFVDVCTFNVYLHERPDFCKYLSRLQHLAGELPLLMTEIGMCSFRHGPKGQAAFLDWQLEEIFDHGLTGAIVFGWTDPFYQDNCLVTDWGFGLVDADRNEKPSYSVVERRYNADVPFSPDRKWPRISVVVALHNAASTLDDCLGSLLTLNYPDYEVIVVNDGSTDASATIMERYPFRHFTLATNSGISAGRNVGLREATGQIVAYIDADARADPDWLSYLAATYLEAGVDGAGGPNIVPREDAWVAQCVYRAPGGPTQVMFNDRYAEHIPGCNMSFRKAALEAVGGFDEQFRKAADDVDICWRLIEHGFKIGFSPSAVVWHHRRPSIRAYWRQQVGYGESEALLERKFPSKFNPWGHTFWGGRIYAPYPFFRLFSRPVVYQGLWGSAPFQSMYDPGGGGPLTFLPRAMEWHFGVLAAAIMGVYSRWAMLLSVMCVVYTAFYCAVCALSADVTNVAAVDGPPTRIRHLKWRATLAWLNFIEPLARDWGRLKGGLTPWRSVVLGSPSAAGARVSRWWQRLQPFRRRVSWTHGGGPTLDRTPFLEQLTTTLRLRSCSVGWNSHAQHWDLKVRRGVLGEAQVHMVVEHHGGAKRLARLSAILRPTRSLHSVQMAAAGCVAAAAISGQTAGLLVSASMLALAWVAPIIEANRLEAVIQGASEDVTRELNEAKDPRESTDATSPVLDSLDWERPEATSG